VLEYGLLVSLVALIVLVGAVSFGDGLRHWLDGLASVVTSTGT
jgi:Flp pilus assembly pilin Flp